MVLTSDRLGDILEKLLYETKTTLIEFQKSNFILENCSLKTKQTKTSTNEI